MFNTKEIFISLIGIVATTMIVSANQPRCNSNDEFRQNSQIAKYYNWVGGDWTITKTDSVGCVNITTTNLDNFSENLQKQIRSSNIDRLISLSAIKVFVTYDKHGEFKKAQLRK